MTTQLNQLTELTTTSDDDLILIRENSTGIDKKMKAQNIRAKATTKADVGLGNVDNVSAADLRDRSTHTGSLNNTPIGDTTASTGNFTNLAYTGTLTGGTGVVNLGSGQVVKDASGNVGIGTTAPATNLEVFDNDFAGIVAKSARTVSTQNIGGFRFADSSGTLKAGIAGTVGGDLELRSGNNTERLRITSDGNVGIGTSSPSNSLSVVGTANAGTLQTGDVRSGCFRRSSSVKSTTNEAATPIFQFTKPATASSNQFLSLGGILYVVAHARETAGTVRVVTASAQIPIMIFTQINSNITLSVGAPTLVKSSTNPSEIDVSSITASLTNASNTSADLNVAVNCTGTDVGSIAQLEVGATLFLHQTTWSADFGFNISNL